MKRFGNVVGIAVVGIMFVFKSYVIVIGQKPVLVALNKGEANMAIIDPATMTVTGKVAVGDGPHEVVLSADGKTAATLMILKADKLTPAERTAFLTSFKFANAAKK